MRIAALVFLTVVILSLKTSASPNLNEGTDRKENTIQSAKEGLIESEVEQRKVLAHLFELNRKIKISANRTSQLNEEVLFVEAQVRDMASSIAELEELVEGERIQLGRRLKAIYQFGSMGFVQSLFLSQSGGHLDRNLRYLKKISQRDFEFLRDHESNLRLLQEKRSKLKVKVRTLVQSRKTLKAEDLALNADQKEKSRLLVELRSKRDSALAHIRKLRDQMRGTDASFYLDPNFDDLSFFERKGELPLPIVGELDQDYGVIRNSKYRYKIMHRGLQFNAPKGTPIRSVANGTVDFVGTIEGLGKVIVVNHGDFYFSVYAQNEKTLVTVGETIRASQKIGLAGTERSRESNFGMYFELRHFSDTIDPKPWFRVQKEFKKVNQL